MAFLLGIDVGTQSLRACLFDLAGNLIYSSTRKYPTFHPKDSWVEQNPEDWRQALILTVRDVVSNSGVNTAEIKAVSYDCTSCTVVVLDEVGQPLRPAIMWMDERAWQEAETITKLGAACLKYTGGVESPQWMIPKALWLSRHEPEVFARARWIIEQTDYLTLLLTGRVTASISNASAKWHYALPLGGWPHDLLADLRFTQLLEKWPQEIRPVGASLGHLCPEFAQATGLSLETVVVQGGVDAHAAMVGSGALREGDMALVIGTSTCHMAQSTKPIYADIWGPYPDAVEEGMYTLGGGQSTTGSITKWLLENYAPPGTSFAELDHLAEQIPPGSEGLVALDFFQGNRTPFKDPLARGAIWGLSLRHGLAHIYRAFYEAVAYGTLAILDRLDESGYHVKQLFAAGGGAKSRLWMQIHADVTGRPVQLLGTEEPAALGAAIWAGIGCNLFNGYSDAVGQMVQTKETLYPDINNKQVYRFYYQKYLETYYALRPLMHEAGEYLRSQNR